MSRTDIKIHYLILAHKEPQLLRARLIRRLAWKDDAFHLHLDKQVDPKPFQEALSALPGNVSVTWLRPHVTRWAEFGLIQVTLDGLASILASDSTFDYVVLLSGQDYPIKPLPHIHQYLAEHYGNEFITWYKMPTDFYVNGGMFRVEKQFFTFLAKRRTFPPDHPPRSLQGRLFVWLQQLYFSRPRPLPPGLELYGGSQWWALTREAARYCVEYVQANPGVRRFFQYAWAPDEIFFQTVLSGSGKFREAIVFDNDLHFYDWRRPMPPYPAILKSEDLPTLKATQNLWARKFDPQIDLAVLDRIDTEILEC